MERLTSRRDNDNQVCLNIKDRDVLTQWGDYLQQVCDKLAAYEDAEEQGRLVRTPYKVGDLFWAVAYSDPRVIHVRLYQVTYHYKDGWVLWVENIANDNDWWKLSLEAFETWSCFDSYEAAEAAMKGETEDV